MGSGVTVIIVWVQDLRVGPQKVVGKIIGYKLTLPLKD